MDEVIEIQLDGKYYMSDLQKFLKSIKIGNGKKKKSLPFSKPTLLKYEKQGKIPQADERISTDGSRIYYGKTILRIAEILKNSIIKK